MSTQLQPIRFFAGRKHLLHKKKSDFSLKGLSSEEIYERKQQTRRNREEEIARNDELANYFNWIFELQIKARLSDKLFAKKLGVSSQTIRLWRRRSGHFPSELSYRRLIKLEQSLKTPIKVKNFRVEIIYGACKS